MGLRKQSLGYTDEASQYGFDDYASYKKANRGGLKGGLKGAATGAKTGASIGGVLGTAIPGVGNLVGLAAGATYGAGVGGGIGLITGNRQMKKDYLDYAKQQTLEGQQKEAALAEQKRLAALYPVTNPAIMEDETISTPTDESQLYSYRMKNGGLNSQKVLINVEGGELLVDQKTGAILEDYKDKPKHPAGKNNVDVRGFTHAKEGTVVIPAKYREKYLSKEADRLALIQEVIANSDNNMKAEDGFYNPAAVYNANPDNFVTIDPAQTDPYLMPTAQQAYLSGPSYGSTSNQSAALPDSGSGNSTAWMAGIPQTALGAYQFAQSKKGLKELQKQPLQMYNTQVQPEMGAAYRNAGLATQMAEKRARTGFSADELAAYKGNIAQQSTQAYQRGLNQAGGSLAGALMAGINAKNTLAFNELAAKDAAIKERKIATAQRLDQYQNQIGESIARLRGVQENANTRYAQGRREKAEDAYGRGMSSGLTNLASGSSSILGAKSGGQGGLDASKLAMLAQLL